MTEKGFTEILALAEHFSGVARVISGLAIPLDGDENGPANRCLVELLGDEPADVRTRKLCAEIRAVTAQRTGRDQVPNFWRAIAHDYHFAHAAWYKEQVVLAAGDLDAPTKLLVAIAVAMANQSEYFVRYLLAAARHQGLAGLKLVRLAALVDHFTCFNKVAEGMRIDLEPRAGRPGYDPQVDAIETRYRPAPGS